jgi:hypothetical protein
MIRFALVTLLATAGFTFAADPGGKSPAQIPGLITFWDFQGDADAQLTAKGPHGYKLQEMNGPIQRGEGGVFGPSSLVIRRGQWLRIPRADAPALNRVGADHVSIVAWIQRDADHTWHFIAGMWDENARRQYALFTSGHKQAHWDDIVNRTDARHQAHGYVSDVGGATPGCKFCFSYGTGRQHLERGRWYMIGFSYDQREIRVYVDGKLSENGTANPFKWNKPIFDPGADGPDFTIAQRGHPKWPEYPMGVMPHEGFHGVLGGLAVYDRALSAEEFEQLYAATLGK